jgi:thioredoxin
VNNHPLCLINMEPSEFQIKTTQTDKPVIVDFWAPWCAPCRASKPILEKLAGEYEGRVDFLPVNADDSRALLEQFHIAGIPTVMAFRKGEIVARVMGAKDETAYRTLFESLAEGKEVKVLLSRFDRILRLGTGLVLVFVGGLTRSWIPILLGAVVAFFGVYDRCPVWAAVVRVFKKRKTEASDSAR